VTWPLIASVLAGLLLLVARISNAPLGDRERSEAAVDVPRRMRGTDSPARSLVANFRKATSPPSTATGSPAADIADVRQPPPATLATFATAKNLVQDFALAEALSENASNAETYLNRLCAESSALRKQPALRELQTRERDAATFMAPLIDYERPINNPPGQLHLPDDLSQRITSYGADWPNRITDTDLSSLDFSWLVALDQFDHWTLLRAGRLRDVAPANIFLDPIPNYVSLQLWSKLRLPLGLRRGDLASAFAEVRHLADLIRSQGILIAEMIAVSIYKMDARVQGLAAAADVDAPGWYQLHADHLDRYRRITYASVFFTFPGVKPETVKKALDCMLSPCVALVDGVGVNRAFGTYASIDNLRLLQQIAVEHDCEAALIARAAGGDELAASQIPKHLDPPR
jgi:hypothetical protein